jgi:hypothetical protein
MKCQALIHRNQASNQEDGAALNTALDHTSASATPKTNFVQLNRLVTPIRTGRSSLFPNRLRYRGNPDHE